MIALVTLATLLIASVVAFAINSSNSHAAIRSARGVQSLCSTPVQATCVIEDEYAFPSIAAHSSAEVNITVSGVDGWEEVTVTPTGAPEAGLMWGGRVSAVDTVTLRLVNVTSSAITPGQLKYLIVVRSY